MSMQLQQTAAESCNANILTYLEFYSGVGGWSYALKDACHEINHQYDMVRSKDISKKDGSVEDDESRSIDLQVPLTSQCLGSFDHSDLCHRVFLHNFPEMKQNKAKKISPKKKKQKLHKDNSKPMAIEKLTKDYLEGAAATLWMMSPPCQPHTRQHSNQEHDMEDSRSKSFLHLCTIISSMKTETLPRIILLENVIGFESSNSCMQWRRVLLSRNYLVLHFHLNPPQIGIPNDRPRYYCVALLNDNSSQASGLDTILSCKVDNEDCIDDDPPINKDLLILNVKRERDADNVLMQIKQFLDQSNTNENSRFDGEAAVCQNDIAHSFVSDKILSSNASWCFDIVTPEDRRSSCFTHSYGKFIRGTGSVLYIGDETLNKTGDQDKEHRAQGVAKFKLVSPEDRSFDTTWNGLDLKNKVRYFTGREMARLMGFPVNESTFSFPNDCTEKQRWKLMGNSLNVKVASNLCELALRLFLKVPTQ